MAVPCSQSHSCEHTGACQLKKPIEPKIHNIKYLYHQTIINTLDLQIFVFIHKHTFTTISCIMGQLGLYNANNIMATSQPKAAEQHFRQTGKFKPISDRYPNIHSSPNFVIQHFEEVSVDRIITNNEGLNLWRVYLEEGSSNYSQPLLKQLIISSLNQMQKNHGFDQNAETFYCTGTTLVQRLREKITKYTVSYLDYNCVIVNLCECQDKCILQLYPVTLSPHNQHDFAQQISVKSKHDFQRIYLIHKNKTLLIGKTLIKNYPIMEITDYNLQSSATDPQKQILIINTLSTRMVGLKFQDQNLNISNEPLFLIIPIKQIYQYILYKINRIKYIKYKVQQTQPYQHKKQNKTTPDKDRNKHQINKVSMLSTIAVDDKQEGKKTIKLITQPRHLKISQRVATNPKQSNLVPSQNDYPVSVKDEKEKENPYLDQFQNLLYEDEGQQKQLALNDSFEQFQKRQQSQKNMQIVKQLAKRKEKQTEEKKLLDGLKQKIKDLINQEKQWINKNLKLKSDIKKLKQQEPNDQNKEIQEIKVKIAELKAQERNLIEQLAEIKKNNCIEVLVCGEGPSNSSQSQRGKDKMLFHSINNLPVTTNFNPLTTSVRSNTGASKFPQAPTTETNNIVFKSNRPNFPNPPNLTHPMGFPTAPTQSFIQPSFPVMSQGNKPMQMGVTSNNDYIGFPTRHNGQYQQQQGSVPFTSAIFSGNGGRMCLNPLGGKKPSVQVFPTYNNKN